MDLRKKIELEKKLNFPKDDDLEVGWYGLRNAKVFTVYCKCGDNRMLVAKNGIRCLQCARFHSHKAWNEAISKVNKSKRWNAAAKQVPRMIVDGWERRKQAELTGKIIL